MEEVKACRVCLVMDVKMFRLEGPLEHYFYSIVGGNMMPSLCIPCYVCYECAELLRKYNNFREKCYITQSVLFDIIQRHHVVTTYAINSVDRVKTKLASNLTPHFLPPESYYMPDIEEIKVEAPETSCWEFMVDDDVKSESGNTGVDNISEVDADDLPLKLILEESLAKKSKKPKKRKSNSETKRTKAKDKPKTKAEAIGGRKKERNPCGPKKKPVNKDGLTEDDVAMLEDFDVVSLSIEQQIEEVERRKETPNYKESLYKCDKCYKGFLREETYMKHIDRHDINKGDMECVVCKFRFPSRRLYLQHVRRHAKRYACRGCDYVTHHGDQAKRHKQWHDGVTYKCQYCDEVSTKMTSHLSHLRVKHPSQFVCPVCGYSFVSEKGLRMHASMMHRDNLPPELVPKKDKLQAVESTEEQDPSLYCAECDVRFLTEEALKRHMVNSAKHKNSKGHGCRHCGLSFPAAAALRAHHRSHAAAIVRARKLLAAARSTPRPTRRDPAPPAPRYPARCDHCEEIIPNRNRHWKHYQKCHKDKKYPHSDSKFICEICGKGFQLNAFLVYHKRTHTNERTYRCPHPACPKAFYNQNNLHIHMKTHSDSRPHECPTCYKTFKRRYGLQQHLKSHTGARPFSCSYCGKAFTQAASLALHVRNVHMHPDKH